MGASKFTQSERFQHFQPYDSQLDQNMHGRSRTPEFGLYELSVLQVHVYKYKSKNIVKTLVYSIHCTMIFCGI